MSTKCTVAHSHHPETNFHFYQECFDDDNVYLELRGQGIEFEVYPGSVMVRIPVAIWETIRQHGFADITYANWTDAQIDRYVIDHVDRRIAVYQEAQAADSKTAWVLNLGGGLCWGLASDPREEQIKNGVDYLRRTRDEHTRRLEAIERLYEENRRS